MPLRIGRGLARAASSRRPGGLRVAIMGAGAGGMAMGAALLRAGITSFTIFDKNDGVGGTWRENTYPGAQCDIRSHLYSFSFAPKRDWSRLYARQPEILAYLEDVADRCGLRPHLRLRTPLAEARWDDAGQVWRLRTEDGELVEADVLVSGLGMLNVPHFPEIKGLDEFAGPVFHSSRWRHDVDLAGKRVGVIGNGASALQFVPEIAGDVGRLSLFQRSAQWVMPSADRPYTEDEIRRFARPLGAWLERQRIFWRYERLTSFRMTDKQAATRRRFAEANLERGVPDPELRAKLTPDYPIGCKRLIQSSAWYPAISRPHVDVVTDGIDRITPAGVVTADGTEHPLDVLVLATGFKATDYLCAVDIFGAGGRSLRETWADGAEAYRGVAVSGFPNLFLLYGPNTNQPGNSIIFVLESQARFVMSAIRRLLRTGAGSLEVRQDAQDRFNREIQAAMTGTIWDGGCDSYYQDPGGKITTQWPHRATRYRLLTRRLRASHFTAVPRTTAVPAPAAADAAGAT
ncbi:flavin-containing monooxygenase [Yinghuangia soli]|uniref:NAD(P)/FAD-dependent oxidoreductase n=1 Tax=Yinghuangia soli TaxID=2908204 RepID=A0AA41Q7U1_9ACTN|nr:NAD(P)/FAD-dependent oxidoreductase [Yinghuangia soli]MCF2532490.1 NAD(P)/FAD-dependent oxidoreductase [Yinghuangia soli]